MALEERWYPGKFLFGRRVRTQEAVTEDEIEKLIRAKKEEWVRRGISPEMQTTAEILVREWAESMTRYHTGILSRVLPPEEVERLRPKIMKELVKTGLNTLAERWLSWVQGMKK